MLSPYSRSAPFSGRRLRLFALMLPEKLTEHIAKSATGKAAGRPAATCRARSAAGLLVIQKLRKIESPEVHVGGRCESPGAGPPGPAWMLSE